MTCTSCHRDRPDVRLVVRSRPSGFGYTTRRFHSCLDCFPEPAAPAASFLAPGGRAVIRRPDEVRDAAGLLGANGALLTALAAAERELGTGLADGVLDTAEAVRLTAALTETRVRIDALLSRVGGVR